MDKLKIKHNHKLTDILKVLIFAIVMMAPIFAIATKCLYVVCNKNAYQSYKQNYVYQETETSSFTPTENQEITLKYNDVNTNGTSYFQMNNGPIEILSQQVIEEYGIQPEDVVTKLEITPTKRLSLWLNGTAKHKDNKWGNTILEFTIKLNGSIAIPSSTNTWVKTYTTMLVSNSTLDNVFYDAIEEITEEKTFNWTTNTSIYTTINDMFTGLEMPSNNALAIMLTYWMICMLIYLVIDIIVALITKMTHLFNE